MKSKSKDRRVFVSHAGADTWVARQIAREIKACGAVPFLDVAEIEGGDDFEKEVLRFLKRAHELVVLLNPWSVGRRYVWAELGAAWVRGIPIVVLLQGISAADLQTLPDAPVFVKKTNCRDLNDVDRYFSELKARVKKGAGKVKTT